MPASGLLKIQEEMVELEERVQRTRLLRTAPLLAWVLFVVLSVLPFGAGSTVLAAGVTRFWLMIFSSVMLPLVGGTWVVAHRRLRQLEAERSRLVLELEGLRRALETGPGADSA